MAAAGQTRHPAACELRVAPVSPRNPDMTTTCPQCSMSLSLDDTRLPSEPFTVVCPRCRQSVTITPPPQKEAVLAGVDDGAQGGESELLRVLSALLSGVLKQSQPQKLDLDKWQRRRIVLCVDDAQV